MQTKEDYLKELKEKGFVKMKIHPEHIGKIMEKYNETERVTDIKKDKEADYNIAKKRAGLARDELWYTIHESYDDTMSAVRHEAIGQEIDTKTGTIIFRNQKEIIRSEGHDAMKKMGIPQGLADKLMSSLEDSIEPDDE